MTPPLDDERRLAEAACRDTIQRSADYADRHDAQQLAALFTADARLQRPGGQWFLGCAAIAAAYAARPASAITRHLVVTLFVEA